MNIFKTFIKRGQDKVPGKVKQSKKVEEKSKNNVQP
jgi:hypothetical protein